jgi:LPS sulfotransferase NodH
MADATRATKFLVTCPARTGSTMLMTLLQSHPDVCAHGEVLAPTGPLEIYGINYRLDPPIEQALRAARDRDAVRFLREFIWEPGHRVVAGFKGKYEELLRPEYHSVLEHVTWAPDEILVIHLWRENLLERFVSQYLAVKVYGRYNLRSADQRPAEPTLRLSADECRADFERTERRRDQFRHRLAKHRVLELTYEDLVEGRDDVLTRVQEFLGVGERALESPLVKMRTRTARETIENFDELATAFGGSPYERFFSA